MRKYVGDADGTDQPGSGSATAGQLEHEHSVN